MQEDDPRTKRDSRRLFGISKRTGPALFFDVLFPTERLPRFTKTL